MARHRERVLLVHHSELIFFLRHPERVFLREGSQNMTPYYTLPQSGDPTRKKTRSG